MAADVVLHLRAGSSCAKARARPLHLMNSLQLFTANMLCQDVATDQYGPLEKTAAGNEYFIVITEVFTKIVRAISMGRVHAIDCDSVLSDYWIAAYGPPDRILLDGGPQFTARFSGLF